MGNEDIDEMVNFDVEMEWKRVEKLLSQKSSSSWNVAMIEAHKIFRQTLDEVSFGDTTEEKIHNASEILENMTKLLQAHELYLNIVNVIDYQAKQEDVKRATDVILRAILDMMGRDFERRGIWHQINNSLNFFWGNHPKFLVYVISGILGFVGVVWILDKNPVGKWFVDLAVGFSEFIVSSEVILIGLLAVWFIALALHFIYFRKK